MGRPSKTHALSVWMNGERVGSWTKRSSGLPEEFTYSPEWLMSAARRPISLSMPLGPLGTTYRGPVVTQFFDNLLPDSRGIRDRLRQRFEANSTGAFDLLREIGRDCIGAIQLLPIDAAAPDVRRIEGRTLGTRQIEQLLEGLVAAPIGRATEESDFRISLAGAQEKTALLRLHDQWMLPTGTTPSTHILKLPIGSGGNGIDLRTSVENEWLCAQILAAYGIPVSDCEMASFGDQKVLVVKRFDRRLSSDGGWIARLPQEDFCQATGTAGDQKYEADGGPGIQKIMDVLLGSSQAERDRRDFFRTQILFWMLCAIDGHAKNFSLYLEAGGGYRLTPRYDVLSAFPILGTRAGELSPMKVKMAMAVQGTARHYRWAEIQYRHWIEMARRCGLGADAPSLIDELVELTPSVVTKVRDLLPATFPEPVASKIFEGLAKSAATLASSLRG